MKLYKNPDVTEMFSDEDEEYVLYDTATSKLKMLNKTGAFIWLQMPGEILFDEEAFIADVVSKFKEINADSASVTNDIVMFVKNMVKEGVLLVQSDTE